jgi:hypothetical protein
MLVCVEYLNVIITNIEAARHEVEGSSMSHIQVYWELAEEY